MRILEILLPKGVSDRDLSPRQLQKVDMIQARMDKYVDAIKNPNTSQAGRDFLISKLRDDYYELRDTIPRTHAVAETSLGEVMQWPDFVNKFGSAMKSSGWRVRRLSDNGFMFSIKGQESDDQYYSVIIENEGNSSFSYALGTTEEGDPHIDDAFKGELPLTQASLSELMQMVREGFGLAEGVFEAEDTKYEVYDRRSGERVSGPYADRKRASRAADKKDLEYGAVRYGYRPVKSLTEAVTKLPLTVKDFDLAKKIMEKPIPAVIAPIYIHEIIEDDALDAQIESLVETEPNRDVRPIIAEWFERVMPDQMYHFVDIEDSEQRQKGLLSPIHGYDPHMYKGTNDPITGNAFGRFN